MPSLIIIYLALALSAASLILAALALWQTATLNKLRRTFFAGRTGADLEQTLLRLAEGLTTLQAEQWAAKAQLQTLRENLGFAVQKVGLVRFNPFADGGGNFSFCIAFLDEHNTGLVITSMHGREQNRVYTKKIEHGECEVPLTEEEQKAILIANQKQKTAKTA